MAGYAKYWDEQRETMAPKEREKVILERIKEQLNYVYHNLPFYRDLYDAHNFKPEMVKTLEDFTTKVPIIKKSMLVEDQKKFPPFGRYRGIADEDDAIRVQGSSGTSGAPTFYSVSKEDFERGAESIAMCYWITGIRPNDLVQLSFPFGVFFGGWGALQGLERLGATVFPVGATESKRQLELMEHVKPTVLTSTISYMFHLMEKARELGFNLKENSIRKLIAGGEPGGSLPANKKIIKETWGAPLHDVSTTSEMYPFLTNVECEELAGPHTITDEVYTEIVNKNDPNVPAPMGERGGIVYTHLWRKSQPMIRFFPGDESCMVDEPCACGRTYPRLPYGIIGRLDDMLVIRGVNIYPSAIEDILRQISGLGKEFIIVVDKKGAMDELSVEVECSPGALQNLGEEEKENLKKRLTEQAFEDLKTKIGIRISVRVVEPGTLDETLFKARRVVDNRKNE